MISDPQSPDYFARLFITTYNDQLSTVYIAFDSVIQFIDKSSKNRANLASSTSFLAVVFHFGMATFSFFLVFDAILGFPCVFARNAGSCWGLGSIA